MRTSLAWVRMETRLVVVSRAAWRLKLRGSVRTETSSSPPRGTAPVATAVAADSDEEFERQPARAERAEGGARDGDRQSAGVSGQKLTHRPRSWPIKIVCNGAVPLWICVQI